MVVPEKSSQLLQPAPIVLTAAMMNKVKATSLIDIIFDTVAIFARYHSIDSDPIL